MTTVLEHFTQTDPMPNGPGTAFESSYAYAMNDPMVFVDLSGLRSLLPSDVAPGKNPVKTKDPQPGPVQDPLPNGRPTPIPLPEGGSDPTMIFFHGTLIRDARSIVSGAVGLSASTPGTTQDFGAGFYTTRIPAQAQERALQKADGQSSAQKKEPGGSIPVIVGFVVKLREYAKLNVQNLGLASAQNEYRRYQQNNNTPSAYDVIDGPLLKNPGAFRRGNPAVQEGDQQAWKTPAAVTLLNKSPKTLTPVIVSR